MNESKNNKVNWVIFAWAMGVILLVIGWLFTRTLASENIAREAKDGVLLLQGDLKVIQGDVSWIRQILEKDSRLQSQK